MILIIAATNRKGSVTRRVAETYERLLKEQTDETVTLISIHEIQKGMFHEKMYDKDGQGPALKKAQDELFIPASKWIIVSPEYNGSYPGALKLLLDALSVRKAGETFHGKKIGLVGLSSGRNGNWLGMNHLTAILNYLKMNVYFNKLAITHVDKELDKSGYIARQKTLDFLDVHIRGFLAY